MSTKEAVVVMVQSEEVWNAYIAKLNNQHVTRIGKKPTDFPSIVIERITDGWCGTAEAQVYTTGDEIASWANRLTSQYAKDATKRWDLDIPVAVENWPTGIKVDTMVSA